MTGSKTQIECKNEKDQLHREDGPAINSSDGTKQWRQNGLRHRLNGPAIIYQNGTQYWYVYNQNITAEIKKEFPPYDQWTDIDFVYFKLKYA